MSGISQYQAGQSDLELAARDLAVLLCPYDGSHPLLPTLEASGGGLEEAAGGVDASTVRSALLAYRRGDPAWRRSLRWSPL